MRKTKLIELIAASLIIILLATAYFIRPQKITVPEKTQYYIYASSYPVYAVSALITDSVPAMNLRLLTQPQYDGYSEYTLSDWDKAIMDNADALVCMGFGFEGFSDSYINDNAAVITLLSMMELKNAPEECLRLDFLGEESAEYASPYLYMSAEGFTQLCEVMCGSMALLDQKYSGMYYENLDKAYELLKPISDRSASIDALNGKKVAVAHEALIYTAYDMDADIALYIKRQTAQKLTESEINECVELMQNNGIDVLLIERQAGVEMIHEFEKAGISVISQELMCDMTAEFGYRGFIDAFERNLSAIERIAEI